MNRKNKSLLIAMAFVILSGLLVDANTALGQGPGQRPRQVLPPIPIKGDTTHTLSKHFTVASNVKKTPDANGFIQRWHVLEPIKKDIARNNILTEKYLRTTFSTDNFSNDFTVVLKTGFITNGKDRGILLTAYLAFHYDRWWSVNYIIPFMYAGRGGTSTGFLQVF